MSDAQNAQNNGFMPDLHQADHAVSMLQQSGKNYHAFTHMAPGFLTTVGIVQTVGDYAHAVSAFWSSHSVQYDRPFTTAASDMLYEMLNNTARIFDALQRDPLPLPGGSAFKLATDVPTAYADATLAFRAMHPSTVPDVQRLRIMTDYVVALDQTLRQAGYPEACTADLLVAKAHDRLHQALTGAEPIDGPHILPHRTVVRFWPRMKSGMQQGD